MPTKFVRVKDAGTKAEYSVSEEFAKNNSKALTVLEGKDAVDDNGRPLPGKPYVELDKADDTKGEVVKDTESNTGTPATTKGGGSAR